MPTYICRSQQGRIPREARARIAAAITDAHHHIARAPRYLVQVLFEEIAADSHFIGGHPAPVNQVWLRGEIRAGRSEAQKEQLLVRLTGEIAEILRIPAEEVWVYLGEIPGGNMTEYGHLLSEPGTEAAWFSALPAELQARLRNRS